MGGQGAEFFKRNLYNWLREYRLAMAWTTLESTIKLLLPVGFTNNSLKSLI